MGDDLVLSNVILYRDSPYEGTGIIVVFVVFFLFLDTDDKLLQSIRVRADVPG